MSNQLVVGAIVGVAFVITYWLGRVFGTYAQKAASRFTLEMLALRVRLRVVGLTDDPDRSAKTDALMAILGDIEELKEKA